MLPYSPSHQKHAIDSVGIGILVIIVDDFPHEALWKLWLQDGFLKSIRVAVWIHAKYPEKVKSNWVRERLVKTFHLQPAWGSLQITEVMMRMLDEV